MHVVTQPIGDVRSMLTRPYGISGTHQGDAIYAIFTLVLQLASASPIARADSLYFAGNPVAALATCDDTASAGGDSAALEWRAARSLIAMGMAIPDGERRRALYDTALTHARRARTLAPSDLDARYWLAAAAGRRAHRSDPIYSAHLAQEVYEQASAILAIDSTHAGAHHMLGKLHLAVLRIPRLLRAVIGRMVGNGVLRRANEADAERHLRRAAELEPQTMVFLVDLAAFYARKGERSEVAVLARRIAATPSRHPMDETLRREFLETFRATSGQN